MPVGARFSHTSSFGLEFWWPVQKISGSPISPSHDAQAIGGALRGTLPTPVPEGEDSWRRRPSPLSHMRVLTTAVYQTLKDNSVSARATWRTWMSYDSARRRSTAAVSWLTIMSRSLSRGVQPIAFGGSASGRGRTLRRRKRNLLVKAGSGLEHILSGRSHHNIQICGG